MASAAPAGREAVESAIAPRIAPTKEPTLARRPSIFIKTPPVESANRNPCWFLWRAFVSLVTEVELRCHLHAARRVD